MLEPEEYDVVVLGSGEAGKFVAWSLGSQGKRSVVVERRYVGGSCPNVACLPSKNVIQSAKVANYFRRGAEFGIKLGDWKVEMSAVRDRKRKMVEGLVAVHHDRYRKNGTELILGEGHFIGPRTIEVATADGAMHTLRGEMVVICTGSRARLDPIPAKFVPQQWLRSGAARLAIPNANNTRSSSHSGDYRKALSMRSAAH